MRLFGTGYNSYLALGPVKSGRTQDLSATLSAGFGGEVLKPENVLIVKHPNDDYGKKEIGDIKVALIRQSPDPDEIAELITEKTKHVVITGLSHFEDDSIVDLVDAIRRSGRSLTSSSLNLDSENQVPNHLADLVARFDVVEMLAAVCSTCGKDAYRSQRLKERFEPRCLDHFVYEGRPGILPHLRHRRSKLTVRGSTMFGTKSVMMNFRTLHLAASGTECETFVYLESVKRRGNEDAEIEVFQRVPIPLNNGSELEGIAILLPEQVYQHLEEELTNGRLIKQFNVDEAQLIPGMTPVLIDLLAKGYSIDATGLPRSFNGTAFNDFPHLICYATELEVKPRAYCASCRETLGTENQRMKRDAEGNWILAEHGDPVEAIGSDGKTDKDAYTYEPRCITCFELPGEPPNRYQLPELNLS